MATARPRDSSWIRAGPRFAAWRSAGFGGAAVRITGAGGNRIEATWIGVTASGSPRSNGLGVLIDGSPDNVVGGPRTSDVTTKGVVVASSEFRDGVAGSGVGVTLRGAGATGNRVLGTYIGTDPAGLAGRGGDVGVFVDGAPGNVIGGAGDGARIDGPNALRNVIAASAVRQQDGEDVEDSGIGVLIRGAEATGNVVAGNYIGTDATGTAALGHASKGVWIDNAPENTVGGESAALGNVIAASGAANVQIEGAAANENRVLGNRIGTDATGRAALASESGDGVVVLFGSGNEIGAISGTAGTAPGNVISGHGGTGVLVLGLTVAEASAEDAAVADGNRIVSNLVGTDATGSVAVPNAASGVTLLLQAENTVVGVPGGGNVIAGNEGRGVLLLTYITGDDDDTVAPPPSGSTLAGNHIGANRAGTAALGNRGGGVRLAAAFPPPPDDDEDDLTAARRASAETRAGGALQHVLSAVDLPPSGIVIGGPSQAHGNVIVANGSFPRPSDPAGV